MARRPFLLHHFLIDAAERTPGAPALIEPKQKLDYAALALASARVRDALIAQGVTPASYVGIWSEKTAHAVAAVYGIMRCGAAYVPVDPSVPRHRAGLVICNVGPRVIVATPDRAKLLIEMKAAGEIPSVEVVALLGAVPAELERSPLRFIDATEGAAIAADALVTDHYVAYVLHTSGSTGTPKGVAITHRNAFAFVEAATGYFGIAASDRLGCHAPLHFDLSVFDLYCAAEVGAAVVLFPEYFSAFPSKMAKAIDEHQVTIWNSVVSALALLLDKGKVESSSLASLRAVIFSGERMPLSLLRRVRERLPGATLYNVYGQTEANSSLVYKVGDIPTEDTGLPLGEPFPNFEVFLLDDGKVVTGVGQGELCVRGATVASGGYFRDPEKGKERFVLDPELPETGGKVYRTGDLARRREDGQLVIVGRRDNMVKTRGYRVEIAEVEMAIEAVPGAGEVAVVAIPDESIGNRLVAFVEPLPSISQGVATQPVEPATIEKALELKLPKYMIPGKIIVRSGLPRTSTGKIDRKALIELSADIRSDEAS